MKCRARPEQLVQKAVCGHLAVRAQPGLFWWHHAAGGARSAIEAAIFKSLGTKPGLPDLFLLHRGQLFGLELKAANGRLSEPQEAAHAGCSAKPARSWQPPSASMQRSSSWKLGDC